MTFECWGFTIHFCIGCYVVVEVVGTVVGGLVGSRQHGQAAIAGQHRIEVGDCTEIT